MFEIKEIVVYFKTIDIAIHVKLKFMSTQNFSTNETCNAKNVHNSIISNEHEHSLISEQINQK